MNELFVTLGLNDWKPLVGALLLPPVPWIVLIGIGAVWLRQQRPVGWLLVLPACASMWLSSTSAVGEMLQRTLLAVPPALTAKDIAALQQAQAKGRTPDTAIVVLGGGRESLAPEYGMSNLTPRALARLRYGVWLGRETGLPLAFSGGVGLGSQGGTPEAEVAARIAAQEFGRPLKWTETRSRDTRENASATVNLLREAGIRHIVLVTHGWHMARALRAFEEAVQQRGGGLRITPAPMGLARPVESAWLRWMPSNDGMLAVRDALREWLGRLAGA